MNEREGRAGNKDLVSNKRPSTFLELFFSLTSPLDFLRLTIQIKETNDHGQICCLLQIFLVFSRFLCICLCLSNTFTESLRESRREREEPKEILGLRGVGREKTLYLFFTELLMSKNFLQLHLSFPFLSLQHSQNQRFFIWRSGYPGIQDLTLRVIYIPSQKKKKKEESL